MRFYWDLDTDAVTTTLGNLHHLPTSVRIKGGQHLPVELQFHRRGTPERLAEDTEILLGVKLAGKFEDSYLTSTATWTRPDSDAGFYTATLSTNTEPILDELAIDDDADNDVAAITGAIAEFQYTLPTVELPAKALTFTFQIDNFVNQGDEVEADESTPYPPPGGLIRFFDTVTGYTGGTAGKLDAVVTDGASYNVVAFVVAGEGLRFYQLVDGTDAEASPGIIRPDDFDDPDNARVWKSLL